MNDGHGSVNPHSSDNCVRLNGFKLRSQRFVRPIIAYESLFFRCLPEFPLSENRSYGVRSSS